MKTIVVSGVIANKLYNGGAVWTRLNWVKGLQKLGYRVVFIEQINSATCVDAAGKPVDFFASENLAWFRSIIQEHGLAGSASLILDDGREVDGLKMTELESAADDAVFLLNISGHLALESLLGRFRRRVYLDLDPGYTQYWHQQGHAIRLDRHECFFSVGVNIGTPRCSIPTGGMHWQPALQPVVLGDWPNQPHEACRRLTTIASWRGPLGPIEIDGIRLGPKAQELRKFITLPRTISDKLDLRMEIALDIDQAEVGDLQNLAVNGWTVVNPRRVAGNPDDFRRYVQASDGEFSVAQGMYVKTQSGWFSDRTVRYLASGRPAIVQDTGLRGHLQTGRGLLTFTTLEEASTAIADVCRNYAGHARAARALAEQYFDSDKVLDEFIGRAMGKTRE